MSNNSAHNKRRPVLSDHKRVGKTLVPLPATYGWNHVNYVDRIFPELAWIAFLLECRGVRRGIELATNLVLAAFEESTKNPKPEFTFLSAQRVLSTDDWQRIRQRLEKAGELTETRIGLESFVRCYPRENPIRNLWDSEGAGDFTTRDVELARKVTAPRLNRWSHEGTLVQSVVLYAEARTGRLSYSENVPQPNLEAIYNNFESEEGSRASGHVRTFTTSSFARYSAELGDSWAKYFWRRGLELDPPVSHLKIRPNLDPEAHVLLRFERDFERMATEVLHDLCEKLLGHVDEETHAVVSGLLARQTTLALGVMRSAETWNWDHGPLFLRAMTDCYISLAWILIEPSDRSQKYVLHGLGQEKLWMAHYEELAKASTDERTKTSAEMMIKSSNGWIDGQLFSFLVSVNLGSWTGKSTREMAEEAGCIDLYHHAYTPYSFSAHSTWNHVGKFNSVPADSPLNKYIRLPAIPNYGLDPSIPINAAKYLDKALRTVGNAFNLKTGKALPHDWTIDRMKILAESLSSEKSEQRGQTGAAPV
ncbi:MAG: hypothetical protein JNJ82_11035 [Opitutaceae bacterium]|nr:hypothetical protein [Opitutaceae bacterium]